MANYRYNGVELPALPEWDKEKYPYVILQETGNTHAPYMVCYCKRQPTFTNGGKFFIANLSYPAKYIYYNAYMGWKYPETAESYTLSTSITGVFWSNTDILYSSSYSDDSTLAGTLYLSASDPVFVSDSDDDDGDDDVVETDFMLYNGVKLPKLPAWNKENYPYALIGGPYTVEGYSGAYYSFAAVNVPMEYMTDNGYASAIKNSVDWQASLLATTEELAEYLTADGNILGTVGVNVWGEVTDWSLMGLIANDPILWANFYIIVASNGDDDETVYLYPSDPVPVPDEPEQPEEPEATPHDFYIIKNGVGQKQDVYLRVGGQWVKQDEYNT